LVHKLIHSSASIEVNQHFFDRQYPSVVIADWITHR